MSNRRKDKTLKRVTISVDPDDYTVLESIAERSDVSAAWLIRRSIREFLVSHSKAVPADIDSSTGLRSPRSGGPHDGFSFARTAQRGNAASRSEGHGA